jgi:hypothetical protein
MAKNYERRFKGGRFKRPEIGDAGIRSLKEQRSDIIQSIKVRAAQDKEISNQQISGFDRATSKEQENRQVLKNLENDIFKNKTKNIKVHAGNEIDRLEGEAKELGKKSEFWKNFSTTYSQQFAQAAQSVLDFKDRLWANEWAGFYAEHFPEIIKDRNDTFKKDVSIQVLKDLRIADLRKELKDPEISKENQEETKMLLGILTKSNEDFNNIKAAQIIENANSLWKDMRSTILNEISDPTKNSTLKWNAATIVAHSRQLAINLNSLSRIKPNSEAAAKVHSAFLKIGKAEATKAQQSQDYILTEERNNHFAKAVSISNEAEKGDKLFQLYKSCHVGTYKTSDGNYTTKPLDNHKERAECMVKVLAPYYTDDKIFTEVISKLEIANDKGVLKPIYERHPKWEQDHIDIHSKIHAERKAALDKKEQVNHQLALEEVTKKLQDPEFTLSEDGLADLKNIANKYGGGGEDVQNLIKTAEVFDFGSRSRYLITERLRETWKEGNYNDFYDLYNVVDSDTKKIMLSLKQDLDEQRNASWNKKGKGILLHAEDKVKEVMQNEQVLKTTTGNAGDIVTAYQAEFQMQLEALKDTIPDINLRGIKARTIVDKMLKDKEGIFRRTGEGGSTTWWAFQTEPPDPDEHYTTQELEDKLTQTPSARRRNVNKLIVNHKKGNRYLVPRDTVDDMLINITNGRTVAIPPVLEKLYKINPGKHKTIEEFVNDILGTNIPISVESRNTKLEKEKQVSMRIPNKELYSKKDLAFVHGYMQEFDSFTTSKQFDRFVAAAGGLEMIDIDDDPTYTWLNEPDRNYSRYI